jgi:hypothetical protein
MSAERSAAPTSVFDLALKEEHGAAARRLAERRPSAWGASLGRRSAFWWTIRSRVLGGRLQCLKKLVAS